MSAITRRFAAAWQVASSFAESSRPSPIAVRSVIEYTRWLEAIIVVRSGVTRPRCTARAASISSEATTTSTSPGTGIIARTGSRLSVADSGKIST